MSIFPTCCLHTGRFPKSPPDSHHLNYFMDGHLYPISSCDEETPSGDDGDSSGKPEEGTRQTERKTNTETLATVL